MRLINKTKDKVIAEDINKLENIRNKTTGLLGYDEPESIYFQTRWGIHTIGMNFSIDCIILDSDFVVRKLKKGLKPGNLFVWNPKYKNVIELPSGVIEKTGTEVLDKLSIKHE